MIANIWSKAPLVRLLLPMVAGILSCFYFDSISTGIYLAFSGLFLTSFLVLHLKNFRSQYISGFFIALTCFFIGAALSQEHKLYLKPSFFGQYIGDESLVLVRLSEPLQEKENSYKALAEVEAVINGEPVAVTGKILLYFKKEGINKLPQYGDELLISNTIKPLSPPLSPEVFNYAKFMRYRQVYHSAYLQPHQFQLTGKNYAKPIWQLTYSLKSRLLARIDYYIPGKDERGIAKALILGDETDLLPHVTNAYAGTGTLHVLSVSGLHVGFIFIVLNFLLRAFTQTKTGRYTRVFILLFALGFYGLLTGLSPSVSRSVIMFCFLVVGLNSRKITNIYNSIAFSALFLLLWNPFLVLQLGFQLSYIALLGIVWLYPYLSKFWQPKHKILIWIRDVLAMSVAAQLATFPIGLYYFNQFPSYFLLSNLIVIPWSSIVLFAGCFFLLISLVPIPEFIISMFGKLLYWLIYLLNRVVDQLAVLPFSQWNGAYINIFECLLLYIALALLLFSLIYQHKKLFAGSLTAFIIFFTYHSFLQFQKLQQDKFVVHAIPKTIVLSIKEKNELYFLSDSIFLQNPDQQKFYLHRYAFSNFVPPAYILPAKNTSALETAKFYYNPPFGCVNGNNFLWLRNRREFTNLSQIKNNYQFVILSGNIKLRMSELAEKLQFEKVILAADNSFYRNNSWQKECEELNIYCINLQKDNSFALTY